MGMLRRGSKSRALDLKKPSGDRKSTWSKLPQELVIEILQRLKSYQDFVCATSTCAFWRSIGITNAHTFSGGYQFPWLMPAEGGGGYFSNTKLGGFCNVLKKMTCYLELPEAFHGKKHCLSWHGWLVTVDSRLELNVVHPLSRVQIKLPDILSSIQLDNHELHHRYNAVQKAVFSSSPLSDDYTLCILVSGGRICLWRKGDACWRKMDTATAGLHITDIVFYRGRFYAIDRWGRIYAWDTQETSIIQVVANLPKRYWKELKEYDVKRMYLVESGGSLLMVPQQEHVNMSLYFPCTETTYRFQVFEVMSLCNSNDTNWRQVSDMGGRTLFLGGSNSSFSINASDFPGCKQNCIYFTDNFAGFYGWGIYHLEDGRLENFFNTSPHLWIELTI